MHRFNFEGALQLLKRSLKVDHIGADKMGQLAPDIMGTSKPESLDQCDRILHLGVKELLSKGAGDFCGNGWVTID
jgi:hypothetical protein